MAKESVLENIPKAEGVEESKPVRLDLDTILGWLKLPAVQAGILMTGLILWLYWPFFMPVGELWFNLDGYYQHGPLVPIGAAYIVYAWWPRLTKNPVKSTWWPMPLLVGVLYVSFVAQSSGLFNVAIGMLAIVATILVLWILLGFKWMFNLLPVVGFVSLALPFWSRMIDDKTVDLQILSTKGSFAALQLFGYRPFMEGETIIHLPRFTLNIAAACSGMKLMLAMVTACIFIAMAAKLSWWKNLIILGMSVPLAVAINSLRIGAIGVVGNEMGEANGMWFHDYGSYLFLALAFYIVYKTSQLLGWKI